MRLRSNSDERCERARGWTSERVDGELSELERLLLRRHLGRCDECRVFAEEISNISTTLRNAEELVPTRRILVAAPPRREVRRSRVRVAFAVALIALAAGLGAFAGVIANGGGGGGGETPAPPDFAERPSEPPREGPTPTTPNQDDRPIAPV